MNFSHGTELTHSLNDPYQYVLNLTRRLALQMMPKQKGIQIYVAFYLKKKQVQKSQVPFFYAFQYFDNRDLEQLQCL